MLKAFLRLFASLPLPVVHGIGVFIGSAMYAFDRKFARRVRSNLERTQLVSGPALERLIRKSVRETGKGITESFVIWFRKPQAVTKLVQQCNGWQHVESALAQKHGIIFLTPHLGCFEITAQYYAQHYPMSVLFKPTEQGWLETLIAEGRSRSTGESMGENIAKNNVKLAPTNMRGIRTLLKSLRDGEAVGILPDQVPELGDGVWAEFFANPAYTMTLVSKLAETTQARVLLAFGERLAWGRGFIIHIEPLDKEATPQNINDGIEALVRRRPEQYLWSYRRFKQP